MSTGPKGGNRPADVIGNAIHVAQIATGEARVRPASPGTEEAHHPARLVVCTRDPPPLKFSNRGVKRLLLGCVSPRSEFCPRSAQELPHVSSEEWIGRSGSRES